MLSPSLPVSPWEVVQKAWRRADLLLCGPFTVLYLTSLGKAACKVARALSSLIRGFSGCAEEPCPPDGPAMSPAVRDWRCMSTTECKK